MVFVGFLSRCCHRSTRSYQVLLISILKIDKLLTLTYVEIVDSLNFNKLSYCYKAIRTAIVGSWTYLGCLRKRGEGEIWKWR